MVPTQSEGADSCAESCARSASLSPRATHASPAPANENKHADTFILATDTRNADLPVVCLQVAFSSSCFVEESHNLITGER